MKIAILMGSDKDMPKMQPAADVLASLGVDHEMHVMSAHRTPERVAAFAAGERDAGVGVVICGAGKAAHLAGAVDSAANAAHLAASILSVTDSQIAGVLADYREGLKT